MSRNREDGYTIEPEIKTNHSQQPSKTGEESHDCSARNIPTSSADKTKTIQEEIGILTNRLKNYTNNKQTLDRFYNDLDKLVKQATLSQRQNDVKEFKIFLEDIKQFRMAPIVMDKINQAIGLYEQEIKNGNI